MGKTFSSDRPDGRFMETAGFYHRYLQQLHPRLAFNLNMTREQAEAWRNRVRKKLRELMDFPEVPPQPEPHRIWSRPREGYRLERWEAYPEPYSVVPFYILVPDGTSDRSPAPAVMCFSGAGRSKEYLAGEPNPGETSTPADRLWLANRMAWHYARAGMIAVALDSPATHETASPLCSREATALAAIWMGRSYESVSVFQKTHVLEWLLRQPWVAAGRVALSGHSLGAKPADILGVLYPDVVKAVVHNDFILSWRERMVALNLAVRPAYQVVPGIFQWFDYPDLEAALAPCPLLFTEGGRPPAFARVQSAYELWGAADRLQLFHYSKYADPQSRRRDDVELPMGLTMEEYFEYAYVDAPEHRFRYELAVPWVAKILAG